MNVTDRFMRGSVAWAVISEVCPWRPSALQFRKKLCALWPGDTAAQLQWRFAERYDLQMLGAGGTGGCAGPVARLVASGARQTHEWTAAKHALLEEFDRLRDHVGVSRYRERRVYLIGPKNLALALIAFELAWVDAGAATASLAGCLALSPIHERGTTEQRRAI